MCQHYVKWQWVAAIKSLLLAIWAFRLGAGSLCKKFCLFDNVMNNLNIPMKVKFFETVALYVVGARTDKYLIKI